MILDNINSPEDLNKLKTLCEKEFVEVSFAKAYAEGGNGCLDLAKKVVALADKENNFKYIYFYVERVKPYSSML